MAFQRFKRQNFDQIIQYLYYLRLYQPLQEMKITTKIIANIVNSFNAHTILGLHKLADEREIKTAYYHLAKQYHPDSNPQLDTSEQFHRITKAYELMINEANQRKKRTKEKSQDPLQQEDKGSGKQEEMFRAYQAYKKKNNIRSDSFHKFMQFYQNYNDLKKQAKKAKEEYQEQPKEDEPQNEEQQSQDPKGYARQFKNNNNSKLELKVEVLLSKEEAKAGTQKYLKITRRVICMICHGKPTKKQVKCKKCHGSGVHISKNQIGECWVCEGRRTVTRCECSGCSGKGLYFKDVEDVVHIKAGVTNNDELIIKGKGHQHQKRGYFGDMIVSIRVLGYEAENENVKLKKVGFNTYQTVKITVLQAILGTRLKYNTIWGEQTVFIRGGIQDNSILRRGGEGYKKRSHGVNGDHFITVNIEIPRVLSLEENQIYQKIREIYKAKPRKE